MKNNKNLKKKAMQPGCLGNILAFSQQNSPEEGINHCILEKKPSFHTLGSTQVNLFREMCYFPDTENIIVMSQTMLP